jgi:perosamine synthetase
MRRRPKREIPPTAGLPLRARDLVAGQPRLAERAAAMLDVAETQLECSGSAALVIALLALRKLDRSRHEVVVPAYTCPLVAMAVKQAGLTVQLCDVEYGGFDFDQARLAEACSERTLAVIPTHLAGRIVDVDATIQAARQVGAFVIEDAAQAFGARDRGRSVGLRGDIGFFSLAVGKGLSIYEGGLLIAGDSGLRAALRASGKEHAPRNARWETRRCAELLGYTALYGPRGLRLAYGRPLRRALARGDAVTAVGDDAPDGIPMHRVGDWRNAVGSKAIARLPAFLAKNTARAQQRLPRLRAIRGVHVFSDWPGQTGTWPMLLVRMADMQSRDVALEALWTCGLGVSRLFIHALPDYPWLSSADDVPHARDFAARSLTISNSPWLDDESFESICQTIEAVVAGRPRHA